MLDIDREPLGDQPMGKYQSVNTVTRIVPNELLEWNVGLPGKGPFGHVYGWEIAAAGRGRAVVTNYCEWPDIPEFARPHFADCAALHAGEVGRQPGRAPGTPELATWLTRPDKSRWRPRQDSNLRPAD